jgi:hypothetical protein
MQVPLFSESFAGWQNVQVKLACVIEANAAIQPLHHWFVNFAHSQRAFYKIERLDGVPEIGASAVSQIRPYKVT